MKDSSAKANSGTVRKVAARKGISPSVAKAAQGTKALKKAEKAVARSVKKPQSTRRAAKANRAIAGANAAAKMGGGRGGKRMSANRLNP